MSGALVAVKVLDYNLRSAQRIQNELMCGSALQHPNVVGTLLTMTFGSAEVEAQLLHRTFFGSYQSSLKDSVLSYSAGRGRRLSSELLTDPSSASGEGKASALGSSWQQRSSWPGRGTSQASLGTTQHSYVSQSSLPTQGSTEQPSSGLPSVAASDKQQQSTPQLLHGSAPEASSLHASSEGGHSARSLSPVPREVPGVQGSSAAAQHSEPASSTPGDALLQQQHIAGPGDTPMQHCQLQAASSQRRNIDDLFASGPSSSVQIEARNLLTWIVMDLCERGPLSGISVRMADDAMSDKLVGAWACLLLLLLLHVLDEACSTSCWLAGPARGTHVCTTPRLNPRPLLLAHRSVHAQ
jgi:hypothetical protein